MTKRKIGENVPRKCCSSKSVWMSKGKAKLPKSKHTHQRYFYAQLFYIELLCAILCPLTALSNAENPFYVLQVPEKMTNFEVI